MTVRFVKVSLPTAAENAICDNVALPIVGLRHAFRDIDNVFFRQGPESGVALEDFRQRRRMVIFPTREYLVSAAYVSGSF